MGCSQSRLEPDEEAPHCPLPAWRRGPDVRLRRDAGRMHKDSIVSTIELLCLEDPEDELMEEEPEKAREEGGRKEEKKMDGGSEEKEGVEKGEGLEEEEKAERTVKTVVEEVSPGSPSFRVYCNQAPAWQLRDEDLVKAILRKDHGEPDELKKGGFHGKEDSSESMNSTEVLQSSESRSLRTNRGGRLGGLARGSGAVCNFLNTRGCSNKPAASSRVKPQELIEKSA